jgi:mannonate dehydratase
MRRLSVSRVRSRTGHREPANEVFTSSYTFHDGYMHPGDAPGIGVEFNEEAAAGFPFDPKYLPINRRLDGSVHDW